MFNLKILKTTATGFIVPNSFIVSKFSKYSQFQKKKPEFTVLEFIVQNYKLPCTKVSIPIYHYTATIWKKNDIIGSIPNLIVVLKVYH